MVEIGVHEERIAVTGDTYRYREMIKSIPGRKWHKDAQVWTLPPTPYSLDCLIEMFPDAPVSEDLKPISDRRHQLKLAQEAKTSTALDEIMSKTEPWQHQLQAFWFAYHRLQAQGGAMLALDMGCGKSKVTIDLINALGCTKVLVVCPTSVMDVWPDEFKVHSCWPAPVHLCDRKLTVKKRKEAADEFLEENEGGVIVVNHEAVWRKDFAEWAIKERFDMVVCDESHRAKSPGGKLSRFLSRIGDRVMYRLALTGTPCPHDIMDMYGQARFIDKSIHGTNFQVYKSEYAVEMPGHDGTYKKIVGFKNAEKWNECFHNLAVQVKAEDALDLPEAIHVTRTCELDSTERAAYNEMKEFMITQIEDGVLTASNALVKMLRLAQITQGVAYNEYGRPITIGESKRDLLCDVVEDIVHPVVVFCRFKSDLESVHSVCGELARPCFELSGDVKDLHLWKSACENGDPAVIAVQLQAGGVGISMVQAKYCIYLSKDFNLGNYEQSLARTLRPGQKNNVTYIHVVAKDTIDETINSALVKRKDVVEALLGEMGGQQ